MKKVKVISSTTQPDVLGEYLWYDPVEETLKTNINTKGDKTITIGGSAEEAQRGGVNINPQVSINTDFYKEPGEGVTESCLEMNPVHLKNSDNWYAQGLKGSVSYENEDGKLDTYQYCDYNFTGECYMESSSEGVKIKPAYETFANVSFSVDYYDKKIYINGEEFGGGDSPVTYTDEGSKKVCTIGERGTGVVIYGGTTIGESNSASKVTISGTVNIGDKNSDVVGAASTSRVEIAPDVVIHGGASITTNTIKLGDKNSNNTYIQFSENAVTFYNNGKSATLTLS
jgi:hypothetical protein